MTGPERDDDGGSTEERPHGDRAPDEHPPRASDPSDDDGFSTDVGRTTDDGPTTHATDDEEATGLAWLLTTDRGDVVILRDIVSSVGTVALIGLILFGISGLWPPLVAVESGSMEPHMHRGDLVFIMDEARFPPDAAVEGTGIVTYRQAAAEDGYWSFGDYGNVIVYKPDGGRGTPIIHRARFHVEAGENWVDPPSDGGTGKAQREYLGGATTCAQVRTCPAPHDGFVTLGDANNQYDQVAGQSTVVKSEWIRGRAKVRIPWLGFIRLLFGGLQTGVGADVVPRFTLSLAGAVGVVGLRRAS